MTDEIDSTPDPIPDGEDEGNAPAPPPTEEPEDDAGVTDEPPTEGDNP